MGCLARGAQLERLDILQYLEQKQKQKQNNYIRETTRGRQLNKSMRHATQTFTEQAGSDSMCDK